MESALTARQEILSHQSLSQYQSMIAALPPELLPLFQRFTRLGGQAAFGLFWWASEQRKGNCERSGLHRDAWSAVIDWEIPIHGPVGK